MTCDDISVADDHPRGSDPCVASARDCAPQPSAQAGAFASAGTTTDG